jgi:hypothetical protein
VRRHHVYHGALATIGLCLGLPAAWSLGAGDRSVPIALVAVGGLGMAVSAGYESLRTDPDGIDVSAARLLALVGAACLGVVGTALSVV